VKLPTHSDSPHLEAAGLLEADVEDPRARSASRGSHKSTHSGRPKQYGFLEVVRDPATRPAIVAVVGVMFIQQFTGINSVMMYSVSVLSELFPSTSALLTLLISVVNLVVTIGSAPLPDALGRKKSLMLSLTGLALSCAGLGLSMAFSFPMGSAISIIAFIASFALGTGPIPFMLASELVGTEAKGATQSWALASNWIGTYVIAQFFPIVNETLNGWLGWSGSVYFGFSVVAVLGVGFVGRWVPETRGRSVEEVWGERRGRRVD
jgi:MFS family permease